ncbi:hypothetical protein CYMTET_15107, partial [Cymbomonas tetramitiformis]
VPFLDDEGTEAQRKCMVHEVMLTEMKTLQAGTPVEEAYRFLKTHKHTVYPLVDDKGHLLGLLHDQSRAWSNIHSRVTGTPQCQTRGLVGEQHMLQAEMNVEEAGDIETVSLSEFNTVDFALRVYRSMGLRLLPVVDSDNRLIGVITRKELLPQCAKQAINKRAESIKDAHSIGPCEEEMVNLDVTQVPS